MKKKIIDTKINIKDCVMYQVVGRQICINDCSECNERWNSVRSKIKKIEELSQKS